jgi:hypothetical protein
MQGALRHAFPLAWKLTGPTNGPTWRIGNGNVTEVNSEAAIPMRDYE